MKMGQVEDPRHTVIFPLDLLRAKKIFLIFTQTKASMLQTPPKPLLRVRAVGKKILRDMAKKGEAANELLNTLADFTSKENWDKFFSIRGRDDSFEWYAEWSNLRESVLSQLLSCAETLVVSNGSSTEASASLQILVPGCGNSRLSEHIYDAGFHSITNIDFSKVVISDMLRRNIRARPDMKWRVMDMTHMQFTDFTFDTVLDKGGLDALMEPELGSKLGSQYLSEVKRVLKTGGKFVCLTLAESHVLGLLFSKFRFGWKISLLAIPHKPSKKAGFRTFLVIAEKDGSAVPYQITSSFDHSSLDCDGDQGRGLFQALEAENILRSECSSGADILYSLQDLQLGAKGDLDELILGRRFQLTLGEEGDSRFSYKAVLLDAKQLSEPFVYHCGVFLVPKIRAHEWLFSSEEGQWLVVESSKAARLIMVFLDARHTHATMDDIQKDLSPLVKTLVPQKHDDGARIPFMMASDGVKQRDIVHQVTSSMTGLIIVEDVVYENTDSAGNGFTPSKDSTFRRLTFERSMGLVQSEALVASEGCSKDILSDTQRRKTNSSSKSKRKGSQRKDSRNILNVDHHYLASSYHIGIISGFMLVVSKLESVVSSGRTMKSVIIGLGAGLLPMFLRGCMPCLDIEVVELDPIVLNLARDYFSFTEDKQLKVHIADGIKFVKEVSNVAASSSVSIKHESEHAFSKENLFVPNGNGSGSIARDQESAKIDILIIDADSADASSGMTCPPANFVEESFLLSVKESLSEGGLFVINLVSRSRAVREMVVSRMKTVFSHLFCLRLEEDVNEVLFALPGNISCMDGGLSEAALQLQKLLKFTHPEGGQNILDIIKKINCLK